MVYVIGGLGLIVGLVALIVLVAVLQPSAFRIARSITVQAPASAIFSYINNLKQFQEWNPYREKDLAARNEFSGPEAGPGAVFRWIGDANVGEGVMTIMKSEPNAAVHVDLEFIRPFPGHNDVAFTLIPVGEGTEVTWSMAGRYALIPKIVGLFISMDRMIGGDFETGLQRLKSLVETGSLPVKR